MCGAIVKTSTVCLCVAACVASQWVSGPHVYAQTGAAAGEWHAYGGDKANSKYSALDQIDRDNVARLEIAWRQSTIPYAVRQGSTVRAPARSQNTPLMVGGFLYVSSGLGSVTALDATTGDVVWFDVPPLPDGETRPRGNATRGVAYWRDDHTAGVEADERVLAIVGPYLVDEELGYVYLPLTTPTNDYYGGHRWGDNLFAESLVCLDVRTGERMWHFQAVHHGLWDYDFASAPNLIDITVDGRSIKAVAIVSKQAFTYVLDRVTGAPVWPIEERPVPQSTLPGERTSPTQPFPTKPPAFDQQGVTIDDLIDFTPELRAEAIEILEQYDYGPIFTPPVLIDDRPGGTQGLVQMPGTSGGANWVGAGVDPETGILYVQSAHTQTVIAIVRPENPAADVAYVRKAYKYPQGPQGLPLFKPPYSRLVAIDLNTGKILWTIPVGDGPKDHPAIQHLDLPPLGQAGRAAPLVTKTLVFLGEGGSAGPVIPLWGGAGGEMFRAYDKVTGETIAEIELPGQVTAAPMTYMVDGRQYVVVTVGSSGDPSEYIALSLPLTP